MAGLIESGRIVDWILVFVALEAAVIFLVHRRTGKGIAPADYLSLLMQGLFIFLALRAALTEAGWQWVALWLLASLAAHLVEITRRWQR
ncbi:MAG: hypothetical protein ACFB22_05065 [Rhodothalassiaceae bacterium]